jgi:hypothetical protein
VTELAVVAVLLALFAGAAVLYARRARPHPAAPPAHPAAPVEQAAAALAFPGVDPAFVQQALEQADRDNAATYAAATGGAQPRGRFAGGLDPAVVDRGFTATATGRHRRPDGQLPAGVLGMTGIMAKLDAAAVAADARMRDAIAAETGQQPAVRA